MLQHMVEVGPLRLAVASMVEVVDVDHTDVVLEVEEVVEGDVGKERKERQSKN